MYMYIYYGECDRFALFEFCHLTFFSGRLFRVAFGLFWTRSLVTIWWLGAHAHLSPTPPQGFLFAMQNDLLFSAPQKWVNDSGTITVLWLPETVKNLQVFSSLFPVSAGDCLIYEAEKVTFIKDGRDYLHAHRYRFEEVPNY